MNEAEKTAKMFKKIVEESEEASQFNELPYWAQYEATEVWGIN